MLRNALHKTVRKHPRLVGALFTASVLLMNVAPVLAAARAVRPDPEAVRTVTSAATRLFCGKSQ